MSAKLLTMNMPNSLGYFRGELNQIGVRKKRIPVGKRILEVGFVKKILLAIYNKIFRWYYS